MFKWLEGNPYERWIRLTFILTWGVLCSTFIDWIAGDLMVYHDVVTEIYQGKWPYAEVLLEYPPYVLPLILLPGLMPVYRLYRWTFQIAMLVIDYYTKKALVLRGQQSDSKPIGLSGFAVLTFSSVCAAFLYLKRFDVVPVALLIFATMALVDQKHGKAGALLGISIGVKLYAIVLGPVWLAYAWRRGQAKAFMRGAALALLPLVLIAPWMPWWRMFDFHLRRGVQAESLLAAVTWLFSLAGYTQATWTLEPASYEVAGAWVTLLTPAAKALWVVCTLGGAGLGAALLARRDATPDDVGLASWLPLLSFVAFNTVLSPQYVLWLAGAYAVWLALSPGLARQRPGWLIWFCYSVVVTAIVYPSHSYDVGLDPWRTCLLVSRDLVFVAWFVLAALEALRRLRSVAPTSSAVST